MHASVPVDVADGTTSGETRHPARNSHLGVDIGGTSIKWSVLREGEVLDTGQLPTPRVDHHAVLKTVAELGRRFGNRLAGIGVAVPGTVDPNKRRSVFIPNLPGDWTDFGVADSLEELVDLPVALVNDARAFAWAEHTSGAARDVANALFITLGTGVGGAIAFRGDILVGDLDAVGEIGHVPVDPSGYLCVCGGRGCLETIAAGTAITSHLSRTVAMDQSRTLRALTGGDPAALTAKIIADAADQGDPWAQDAFARAGDALGRAAATISLLLQLEVVVIGGGLRPAADLYLPRVRQALDARISLTGPIQVRSAHYGSEAGSVGAAALAASRFPVSQ